MKYHFTLIAKEISDKYNIVLSKLIYLIGYKKSNSTNIVGLYEQIITKINIPNDIIDTSFINIDNKKTTTIITNIGFISHKRGQ